MRPFGDRAADQGVTALTSVAASDSTNRQNSQLVVGVTLFQHGLETGSLPFASEGHARFLVVAPFLQFADDPLAQHLLFQPAQPFFHRLMSFQFDLDQWVLTSSYVLAVSESFRSQDLFT